MSHNIPVPPVPVMVKPAVDNQRNLGLNVPFATAKAVINGHKTKKFFEESIDFDEGMVTQVLLNEFKVGHTYLK